MTEMQVRRVIISITKRKKPKAYEALNSRLHSKITYSIFDCRVSSSPHPSSYTTFRLICPTVFFRCLSNLGTFTELRTTSFIYSTEVARFDSVSHNRRMVTFLFFLLFPMDRVCSCISFLLVSCSINYFYFTRYEFFYTGFSLLSFIGV